ncbi:TIGR03085 family metal-binding protein [Modestobacter sp. VKM Ac-2985]|uniref:TIGR03085 family metal-binding protein n=1 Tax=Modestobacter sp. VKM Ac-2985 TaxID=3004139 RepID=UPI0022AB5B6B|nr:TIGR03085 family metal-binding protein [Modestobacter sp. VKM Ac-2985]MCZ2837393.1 TIGR03085 family metal-binding protein [Modestobacter sp. VKM Ac-2985]
MPTSAVPVSQSERAALADLLDRLGPDQPTCCEGWATQDMAAHLVVRDRRPDAMPGFVLGGPFARWTDRVHGRARERQDFARLVADVRSGPPAWVPTAWPVLDRLVNTAEMVIHHEDVRRAQPGWAPRELPRQVQDQLWKSVPLLARGGAAPRPTAGLLVQRSDVPDGSAGSERRLHDGEPTTTVTGAPLEVLLWVSGRREVACVDLTVD